jgi:hypothetical protein
VFVLLVLGVGLAGLPRSGGAAPGGTCPPVQNTPLFTIVYGTVSLNGTAAPAGAVVTAVSPRGDVVGCYVVATAGNYVMYVFGEDTSVTPPVPGMRSGEVISFRVNGAVATANPALTWVNDRDLHQVSLSATSAPCYDFNHTGRVDGGDIGDVAGRWRNPARYNADYDVNQDDQIDLRDVMPVAVAWGQSCSYSP